MPILSEKTGSATNESFVFSPSALVAADFSSQNSEKVHFSSALARLLGPVRAVILSEIWYWTARNALKWDGWFYRSQQDWMNKIGVSEDTITRHIKDFEEQGWVETRRGKLPGQEAQSREWVKFFRATDKFNQDYEAYLQAPEDPEQNRKMRLSNKTAKCGNDQGTKPQNAGMIGDKTAKCGNDRGTKPQNAGMLVPEPLTGEDLRSPQGSNNQGSNNQGSVNQGGTADAAPNIVSVHKPKKGRKTASQFYPEDCERLYDNVWFDYFKFYRHKNPSYQDFVYGFDELIKRENLTLAEIESGLTFQVQKAQNLARQRKLVPTPPDACRFFLGSDKNRYGSWILSGLEEMKNFQDARLGGRAVSVGGIEFPVEFDDYLDRLGA